MKELTEEQKAKAYDKALAKARNIVNSINVGLIGKDSFEAVFPELKESNSERIRKELILFFTERAKYTEDSTFNGLSNKEIIAWLEKQDNINKTINRDEFAQGVLKGAAINLITWIDYNALEGNMCLSNMECKDIEDSLVNGDWDKIYAYIKMKLEKQNEQKPADKVVPKFKVGDFVVNKNGYIRQIVDFKDGVYYCLRQETCDDVSNPWRGTMEYVDTRWHLWTIRDVNDGDVIYSRHNTESFEWIGIFKSLDKENKRVFFYGFWHTTAESFSVCGNEAYVLYDDFSPATKEQRYLLFKKMKDAGYEWDSEKKELKRIEQKSNWSEEDDAMLDKVIKRLYKYSAEDKEYLDKYYWLKSLKDRYAWRPSDEQIEALRDINLTGGISYAGQGQELINLYNDLKKLTK